MVEIGDDDIDQTQTQTNRSMGIMRKKSEESGLEIEYEMDTLNDDIIAGEDLDPNDDLSENESVKMIMDKVCVKQKKKDIKQGGAIQTVGKLKLKQLGLDRQKSMEKLQSNKVVTTKKDKFERMIKEQQNVSMISPALKIKNRENMQMIPPPIHDRNSKNSNESNDDMDDLDIDKSNEKGEIQDNNNYDIGNYDDRTMIVHSDQVIPTNDKEE